MLKSFKLIDHPSDIGIKLQAESLEEIFEQSAWGMFSIMCNIKKVNPSLKRVVSIKESDISNVEELLIVWLERLLYIYEVKKMLFCKFKVKNLKLEGRKASISAEIFGERIDVLRHELFVSIKAPTYHMLELFKDSNTGIWTCQVIFDV